MKVTAAMKVKEALEINEKMLEALTWLAPQFERLRNDRLRRAMSGRITIAQAARIARVPLTEALYLLNLTAGVDEETLCRELRSLPAENFEYTEINSPVRPARLLGVFDTDTNIHFVDVTEQAARQIDPMSAITRGLSALEKRSDILLVRHPFDPVPLRELFARKHGLESWAEERRPDDWYIYFFRPPAIAAAAVAHPPVTNRAYQATLADTPIKSSPG